MNRKRLTLSILTLTVAFSAYALDPKYQPIADAMKYAHKAPKGEKRVSDRIIEGTASDEEVKKTLALYKAMADTEPPKGDAAVFKQKVAKLITTTEDVAAKKEGAAAAYKDAVNCKACHKDFREE
jgi:cytochrome c556